ncbi:MAG TPA: UDP-N-acetylmuramoyl-L-alanine--D-glutamate ligase, partial [Rhodopila sp.]|nr:UDP-N-acetylmuramoyl-L-alanine--D-glutamate ligase [Rhodopila sp.]
MSGFAPTLFRGKRFAVVGLGKNGLPAAHALAAMGAEVVAWDDKPEARVAAAGLPAGVDIRDPAAQAVFDFDALVLSPGIPHRLPKPHAVAERAVAAGVKVLCDVELLFQAVRASGSQARFAGITGTNGKSTTTVMTTAVLQAGGVNATGVVGARVAAWGGNLSAGGDAVFVVEAD